MSKQEWENYQSKSQFEIDNPHLIETYYVHGTTALWDAQNDVYYNTSGARLRNIEEYDTSSEGYTPFGDEGY